MSTETLMTDTATTTTEGQATSQTTQAPATGAEGNGQQQQQATEGQNTEGQQANGEGSEGDQGKPQGAPEKYEFVAPEGQQFDTDVIGQFSEVAKDLNLPQDAAQKILDKMAPAMQARQVAMIEKARVDWAESAQTDKEFGGEKLTENLATAKRALDNFGSPELRTLLNESGLGNHPEVIRFMYRAGQAISEDSMVTGNAGGKQPARSNGDYANALYPSQQK